MILDDLDGYNLCQSELNSTSSCHDALKRFVKSRPKLSWKAAIMTRKTMNSWTAVPFFWQAKNLKEFNCKNSDLLIAIKSSFGLNENQKIILKKAHELAFEVCKETIPAKLSGSLRASNKYAFKNYCKSFVDKKIMNGVLKRKCLKIK